MIVFSCAQYIMHDLFLNFCFFVFFFSVIFNPFVVVLLLFHTWRYSSLLMVR